MVWRKVYFDILNRLGVTHECGRRTNGRTDRRTRSLTANAGVFTKLRGQN